MCPTARYVTERHNIQVELQNSKDKLVLALDSIGDAFIALDQDWRISYVIQKPAKFKGCRQEELFDKILSEAVPEILTASVRPYSPKSDQAF